MVTSKDLYGLHDASITTGHGFDKKGLDCMMQPHAMMVSMSCIGLHDASSKSYSVDHSRIGLYDAKKTIWFDHMIKNQVV
jgi:hypothetical protein